MTKIREAVEIDEPRFTDEDALAAVDALGLGTDEARCALGADCTKTGGAPIGFYLGVDGNGNDTGGWAYVWKLPDGRLVCEDCCIAWEEGEIE